MAFSFRVQTWVAAASLPQWFDYVSTQDLQELAYYDRTETAVRPGLMLIKLYLKDMPPSAVPEQFYQARKKLYDETAYLPRGVIGPLVNDEYSDVYFALYALQAPGMPHRELVLQGEDLRQRLLRVPGVEKINILGEQPQKIFVEVSDQRLATYGFEPLRRIREIILVR
jgi:multidrug efflux pump subunit AcrB